MFQIPQTQHKFLDMKTKEYIQFLTLILLHILINLVVSHLYFASVKKLFNRNVTKSHYFRNEKEILLILQDGHPSRLRKYLQIVKGYSTVGELFEFLDTVSPTKQHDSQVFTVREQQHHQNFNRVISRVKRTVKVWFYFFWPRKTQVSAWKGHIRGFHDNEI